jgi:hypothetical protein
MKITIFLIVIEFLLFSASAICTMATSGTATELPVGNDTPLKISDFTWKNACLTGMYSGGIGGMWIPVWLDAHYEAHKNDRQYNVFVEKGDMTGLQAKITLFNDEISKQGTGIDYLGLLFGLVTFNVIPSPFNIIPLLVSVIIGFVIAYLIATALLALIPSWL